MYWCNLPFISYLLPKNDSPIKAFLGAEVIQHFLWLFENLLLCAIIFQFLLQQQKSRYIISDRLGAQKAHNAVGACKYTSINSCIFLWKCDKYVDFITFSQCFKKIQPLITRRSQVQVLSPQPLKSTDFSRNQCFFFTFCWFGFLHPSGGCERLKICHFCPVFLK